jgi:hypothetical protein
MLKDPPLPLIPNTLSLSSSVVVLSNRDIWLTLRCCLCKGPRRGCELYDRRHRGPKMVPLMCKLYEWFEIKAPIISNYRNVSQCLYCGIKKVQRRL